MVQLTPTQARTYWRALLDNATQLIADAHVLHDGGSFGRARSLTVLAEEELGKASQVYDTFSHLWSDQSDEVADLPNGSARDHLAKYRAAYEFGRELEMFWGHYEGYGPEDDDWDRWFEEQRTEATEAAKLANAEKQRGFYVDLKDGEVLAPSEFTEDGVKDPLIRAAQVIEMMLITDHTRMKFESPDSYDSTHDLQWRIMPTSLGANRADFADFLNGMKGDDS